MTQYKVAFDYIVPSEVTTNGVPVELSQDDILSLVDNRGLAKAQLDSLYGLGVLKQHKTSSKIKLKYNNSLPYLQGDSCTNYGSMWVAKVDVPKNKEYIDLPSWEVDWDLDVQGVS